MLLANKILYVSIVFDETVDAYGLCRHAIPLGVESRDFEKRDEVQNELFICAPFGAVPAKTRESMGWTGDLFMSMLLLNWVADCETEKKMLGLVSSIWNILADWVQFQSAPALLSTTSF